MLTETLGMCLQSLFQVSRVKSPGRNFFVEETDKKYLDKTPVKNYHKHNSLKFKVFETKN